MRAGIPKSQREVQAATVSNSAMEVDAFHIVNSKSIIPIPASSHEYQGTAILRKRSQ